MLGKVGWQLVALLVIAGIINYLDRAALSVAAPLITKDLNLDPAQLGVVFSSFFFGYALFCFIGGDAADRYGPRLVLIVSMTTCSLFCGLTASAFSIASLVLLRIIFGMGEGPFCTTMAKFVSNWFPKTEQARAIGLANAGTPLGGAIAGPVVGFVALSYGWRASFILIAVIGLAWVLLWAINSADSPAQHGRVSDAERSEIEQGLGGDVAALQAQMPLSYYLRQPAVIATGFAFFGYAYILYFFLSWFPSYLTMALHLSIQKMAVVTMIPWALGFLGLASGGFICDALGRKLNDPVAAPKLVMVVCLLMAALAVALAGLVSSLEAVVALIAIAVFFMYVSGSTYWMIVLGFVEPGRVGGAAGFVHLIANTAGVGAPFVTRVMGQESGRLRGARVPA